MTTADFKTAARRIECEEDGLYFTRYFFKQRIGSRMIVAPHHQVIQRTLDRVIDGDIRRLIINVPPGYTKTELATINMMGRGLALNRRARFMHLSYSHNLALLNSSTTRSIVKSAAFQSMWPMALRDDADSKAMWWTEYGGGVYASSAAGQVTGFRAGHMESGWQGSLIIDDPVKPDDAYSETIRVGVNTRFNETIRSRLAIETTPIVVIMQRIHYHDLSGYLLRGGSGEQWHHLNLPVLIDNSEQYSVLYPENSHAITDFAHATVAQIQSVVRPLIAARNIIQHELALLEAATLEITSLGGLVPGNPISKTVSNLLLQSDHATRIPALYHLQNVLGRLNKNVNSGQAANGVRAVTLSGGNLYQVASEQYGDASLWTSIADANDLADPQLSGIHTLKIPTSPAS